MYSFYSFFIVNLHSRVFHARKIKSALAGDLFMIRNAFYNIFRYCENRQFLHMTTKSIKTYERARLCFFSYPKSLFHLGFHNDFVFLRFITLLREFF